MKEPRSSLLTSLSILLALSAGLLAGCAPQKVESLTIYSGRSESFISPFLNQFTALTGAKLDVRYGDSLLNFLKRVLTRLQTYLSLKMQER